MFRSMYAIFVLASMVSMVQLVNGDIAKYVAHNSGRRSLIEAVESGSRAGVISALVRGENIEQTDDHGHTALVIALNEGHVELAKLPVEKGADINYVDHDGYTPLMWATHKGHTREVQMLLDEGADPHVQNKDGFNCLMMAAQEGRLEIARMLLNRDAHRTQHHGPRKHDEPKTDHGDTALSIAQREANQLHQTGEDHQKIADLILEYQAHHERYTSEMEAEAAHLDEHGPDTFRMSDL